MAKVMIRCPKTNNPVPTGNEVDTQKTLDNNTLAGSFGPCPECGERHTLSQRDLFLESAGD
jgi:hypothetical protein